MRNRIAFYKVLGDGCCMSMRRREWGVSGVLRGRSYLRRVDFCEVVFFFEEVDFVVFFFEEVEVVVDGW